MTFQTEILYGEAGPFSRQIVTYLQQARRETGVDVQPTAIPFPTQVEREMTGDFEITLTGWSWLGDDMGLLYRCDALPPDGFNFARICNPEFDRLNDASLFELDPVSRRELLIEQGNIANDDAHLGLLYFNKTIFATQTRVRNFFANAYGGIWSLPWMWISDTE